ncbi:MAG: hypothetical protein ACRERU_20595 [Methylococcales bacterium]
MESHKLRNVFLMLLVWLVTFVFAWLFGEAYLRWHYFSGQQFSF